MSLIDKDKKSTPSDFNSPFRLFHFWLVFSGEDLFPDNAKTEKPKQGKIK